MIDAFEGSSMPTTLRRLCGQASTGPSDVVDQSIRRMREPISPPPLKTVLTSPSVWSSCTQSAFLFAVSLLQSGQTIRRARADPPSDRAGQFVDNSGQHSLTIRRGGSYS